MTNYGRKLKFLKDLGRVRKLEIYGWLGGSKVGSPRKWREDKSSRVTEDNLIMDIHPYMEGGVADNITCSQCFLEGGTVHTGARMGHTFMG